MSRTLFALLLFVLFGVGITLFFQHDNGYVLLRYGDLILESSLVFFIVVLVLGVWLSLLLWRSLKLTLGLPRWLPEVYRRHRERSGQRALLRGLLMLLEGRWEDAEKTLAKPAANADLQQVTYLHAAIAAQSQEASQRRDYYLQQAGGDMPGNLPIAILHTQADLQIRARQYSQAIASLELLREKQPDHRPALLRLLQLSHQIEDWARLRDLWPEAERLRLLDDEDLITMARPAYADLLTVSAPKGLEQLDSAWQSIPRKVRQEPELRLAYLRLLTRDPAGHPEAKRIISSTLKHQWAPEIALLFAELETEDSVSQLAAVEAWLKQHGDKPELQLLAGRLCLQNKLWGRARSYLEACLLQQPDPRAWQALGELNLQTQDIEAAAKAFANGLAQCQPNQRAAGEN